MPLLNIVRKAAPGFYIVNGRYHITHLPDGWIWADSRYIGTSGEWRRTYRDALADLAEYIATRAR